MHLTCLVLSHVVLSLIDYFFILTMLTLPFNNLPLFFSSFLLFLLSFHLPYSHSGITIRFYLSLNILLHPHPHPHPHPLFSSLWCDFSLMPRSALLTLRNRATASLYQIFMNPLNQFMTSIGQSRKQLLSWVMRSVHKHAFLLCSPACLPAYLPAYLPICLPAYLPAYLPACLPACSARLLSLIHRVDCTSENIYVTVPMRSHCVLAYYNLHPCWLTVQWKMA